MDSHRIYTVFYVYKSPYFKSMDTIDVRFAHALRELRKSKGLTQEALAQRAGVDYKYLQKLEGSKPSSPTLSTLNKLAKGLQITLVELLQSLTEDDEQAPFS